MRASAQNSLQTATGSETAALTSFGTYASLSRYRSDPPMLVPLAYLVALRIMMILAQIQRVDPPGRLQNERVGQSAAGPVVAPLDEQRPAAPRLDVDSELHRRRPVLILPPRNVTVYTLRLVRQHTREFRIRQRQGSPPSIPTRLDARRLRVVRPTVLTLSNRTATPGPMELVIHTPLSWQTDQLPGVVPRPPEHRPCR